MAKEDRNLVVGLDIGTSKVVALVAEIGPDGGEFFDIPSTEPITAWTRIFEQFKLAPESFGVVGDPVRMSA